MRFAAYIFVLIVASGSISLAQENAQSHKPLKRETAYPDGKQTSLGSTLGTIWTNPSGVRTEQHVFYASYDAVWNSVQSVANEFSRIGKRPLSIDSDRRMAINSNIKYAREANASLIQMTWVDEFVTEVTQIDKARTKVSVKRKVLELQRDQNNRVVWGTVGSNGKIERWILTQIEDGLRVGNGSERNSALPKRKIAKKKMAQKMSQNHRRRILTFSPLNYKSAECLGLLVICELLITNNDKDRRLGINAYSTKMFDESSNEYEPSFISIGNQKSGGMTKSAYAFLVAGVSTKSRLEFQRVSEEASKIALLDIQLHQDRNEFRVQFRDIRLRD